MTARPKLLPAPVAHSLESPVAVLDIVREAADSLQSVVIMLKVTTAILQRWMQGLWKLESNKTSFCRKSAFAAIFQGYVRVSVQV